MGTLGHSARQGDLVWTQEAQNKAEDTGESSMAKVKARSSAVHHEDAASLPSLCFQIHVVTDQEEQQGVYALGQVGDLLCAAIAVCVFFRARLMVGCFLRYYSRCQETQ